MRRIYGEVIYTRYDAPTQVSGTRVYAWGLLVLKHGGDTYVLWTDNQALARNTDSFFARKSNAQVSFDPATGEFFSVS